MERETKAITIGKHTFIVHTYATAREANAIQQAYFNNAKVEVVGETPKIAEFNPGVQFDVEREMIARMVVSLDGDTQNVTERTLDLPSDVYNDLVAQLDGLIAKKKK